MYICICNAVTEKAVRECARNGACSIDELAYELGVGAGCGRCRECCAEFLRSLEQKVIHPLVPSTAPSAS